MREIVFDTETTGVNPAAGDRIVEIGCVELVNLCPTGRTFHCYINPERSMPDDAFRVHGLSDAFLADKPLFAQIAGEFAAFIGEDAKLVAHNAAFDAGFINMEFARLGLPPLVPDRVVDSLAIARRKHPGGGNSLDALCSRYGIDNSRRTKHGALLDAELLAEVYIELLGGRQAAMTLTVVDVMIGSAEPGATLDRPRRQRPLPSPLSLEDLAAHEAFVRTLKQPLWADYLGSPSGA